MRLLQYFFTETKFMRKYLSIFSFVLFSVPLSAFAADIEVGKDIFKLLLQTNITDNNFGGDSEIGRKICEAYKGNSCSYVSSLPEGI